jgi:hypothetical protein
MDGSVWAVVAIGALVGIVELLARYRDKPSAVFQSFGAWLYIGVNAVGAYTALVLLDIFGGDLLGSTLDAKRAAIRILLAGFGSLAFLRSSLFKLRVDQADVQVGPALVLDTLLAVADRGVDRNRASYRADKVPTMMSGGSLRQFAQPVPRADAESLKRRSEGSGRSGQGHRGE